MSPKVLKTMASEWPTTEAMPVIFVGHGSPMNGIEDNEFSRAWTTLSVGLPKPRAVLCVSAHWFIGDTLVHGAARPRTIHDFYGFPEELYAQCYPCPGAPDAARETQRTVTSAKVGWDTEWGIDHGNWIVMKRFFPEANVPVFQLSLDYRKSTQFHYDLAKELAPLRRKGTLIVGSGNLVHNLGMIDFEERAKPFDWAVEFDETAKSLILKGDDRALIHYEKLGPAARLAIPTPDHYWPLLYALALRQPDEKTEFFAEGIVNGSIAMRGVKISS